LNSCNGGGGEGEFSRERVKEILEDGGRGRGVAEGTGEGEGERYRRAMQCE